MWKFTTFGYTRDLTQPMIYTLCYVSKAVENLNATALEDIFLTTMGNNTKYEISGILLFGMGNFFQVLEGDKMTVENLYEKYIKEDPRHSDIFEIHRKASDFPIFKNYSSLFTIIRSEHQLTKIKMYLQQHKADSTGDKLNRLLKPFLLEV